MAHDANELELIFPAAIGLLSYRTPVRSLVSTGGGEDHYAVALDRDEPLDHPENVRLVASGLTGMKAQLARLALPEDQAEDV